MRDVAAGVPPVACSVEKLQPRLARLNAAALVSRRLDLRLSRKDNDREDRPFEDSFPPRSFSGSEADATRWLVVDLAGENIVVYVKRAWRRRLLA